MRGQTDEDFIEGLLQGKRGGGTLCKILSQGGEKRPVFFSSVLHHTPPVLHHPHLLRNQMREKQTKKL